MKRVFCVLLTLALTLGLCGAAAAYEGETPIVQEPVTLTVFTHSGVNASYPPPSNDLMFWQYMEELTGVHIEWEAVASESYEEIISTRLAAGVDLPDIMNVSSQVNAINAGRNGLLVDMAPLMAENGYWINKLFEENPFTKSLMTLEDGSIYAICATVCPDRNQIVPIYNKAWLKQIGAEIPTTTEEFRDVLKKMVGVDFNGNGKDDEVILTAPNKEVFDSFSFTYGLEMFEDWDAFSADENGVVTDNYTSDKQREYLQYLNALYNDKILDPGLFATDWNIFYENAASDRIGVFVCYTSFATDIGNMTTAGQTAPNSEIYTVGVPLKGPYGDQYLLYRDKAAGDFTAITRDCKNPEAAMRWLDTLYNNPAVQDTRYWGFEGVNYSVNENGERELIYPESGDWSTYRTSLGTGQIPLCHQQISEFWFVEEEHNPDLTWWCEQDEALLPYFKSPSIPHIAMTDEEQAIYDLYNADVKTYYREMQAKFVTGQESFDNWDNYVNNMKGLGVDELTKVYQSIYDRTK